MSKKVVGVFVAAALALSGCASFVPKSGPNGEKLVFVDHIERRSDVSPLANNAAFAGVGAVMGGTGLLVGAGLDAAVGTAVTASRDVRISLTYFNYDISNEEERKGFHVGGGDFISRSAWPGSGQLYPKSWAILSSDEKGKIVLPCETPCAPVK